MSDVTIVEYDELELRSQAQNGMQVHVFRGCVPWSTQRFHLFYPIDGWYGMTLEDQEKMRQGAAQLIRSSYEAMQSPKLKPAEVLAVNGQADE